MDAIESWQDCATAAIRLVGRSHEAAFLWARSDDRSLATLVDAVDAIDGSNTELTADLIGSVMLCETTDPEIARALGAAEAGMRFPLSPGATLEGIHAALAAALMGHEITARTCEGTDLQLVDRWLIDIASIDRASTVEDVLRSTPLPNLRALSINGGADDRVADRTIAGIMAKIADHRKETAVDDPFHHFVDAFAADPDGRRLQVWLGS